MDEKFRDEIIKLFKVVRKIGRVNHRNINGVNVYSDADSAQYFSIKYKGVEMMHYSHHNVEHIIRTEKLLGKSFLAIDWVQDVISLLEGATVDDDKDYFVDTSKMVTNESDKAISAYRAKAEAFESVLDKILEGRDVAFSKSCSVDKE